MAERLIQDPVAAVQVILLWFSSSRGHDCGKDRENWKGRPFIGVANMDITPSRTTSPASIGEQRWNDDAET